MPVQSLDLSAVTDATFDGSTVEQINLNGSGIWTKPLSYPTGQARIWGPMNGSSPSFDMNFTGGTSTYNHFSYTGDMVANQGDGFSSSGVLKTSTAQMRFGESTQWAISHLQPTSQGYYLPSLLSVPSYNYNGNSNFWNGISATHLYTRLGLNNTVEVWLTTGVSTSSSVQELTLADLTYDSMANMRSFARGMTLSGNVSDALAPTEVVTQYMGYSAYFIIPSTSMAQDAIKLGHFDANKSFIVDNKITNTPKIHSLVWSSTDQYGNILTYGRKYEFWRASDNSLYYIQHVWNQDPRPHNWSAVSNLSTISGYKWLRKLEGPVNGNLGAYDEGVYLPMTTPYSNETHTFHKRTYQWINGQLTGKHHWHSTKQKLLKLP